MGQNPVILRHQKFTFPQVREWAKWASEGTSKRSGGRERSEQSEASERVSGASERGNGQVSLDSCLFQTTVHSLSLPSVYSFHVCIGANFSQHLFFSHHWRCHYLLFIIICLCPQITDCTYWRLFPSGRQLSTVFTLESSAISSSAYFSSLSPVLPVLPSSTLPLVTSMVSDGAGIRGGF